MIDARVVVVGMMRESNARERERYKAMAKRDGKGDGEEIEDKRAAHLLNDEITVRLGQQLSVNLAWQASYAAFVRKGRESGGKGVWWRKGCVCDGVGGVATVGDERYVSCNEMSFISIAM